jgi:Vanadium chloroperoxidase N-terminal domain
MDAILFWSAVTIECNRLDHSPVDGTVPAYSRGPARSSRATAIAHIAMHDAYFGVAGFGGIPGGTPKRLYLNAPPPWTGGSSDSEIASAVSGAASTVLMSLYSGAAFRSMIEAKVAELAGARGSNGVAFDFGQAIAKALLDLRKMDGSDNSADAGYMPSPAPYRHRPDPASPGQGVHGSNYGSVPPFVAAGIAPLAPYPAAGSAAYNADYGEVLERGVAAAHPANKRTPEQTAIGLYWGYDGARGLGTPPRLYNQILAKIANAMGNNEARNARLFGLANAAMGDCGIYAWRDKYLYDLWRPVVGIREQDVSSLGPSVTDAAANKAVSPPCDPFWLPLGRPATNKPGEYSRTPDFPAYPSGHATFGAATFEIARLFYKELDPGSHTYGPKDVDNIGFAFVSDEMDGKSIDPDGSVRTRHNRKYDSLAEAMYENSISRIYLGVHWRFDGTSAKSVKKMLEATDRIGGVPLGREIASAVFGSFKQA